MAQKHLMIALTLLAAAAPLPASQPDPDRPVAAPAGGPDTRYCMRIEPETGSRIETIKCWTRAEWAEQGVDVDLEWAEEGVAVRES